MRHCYLFVFVEQRYHNSIIALNAILHEYNTTVPSSMQDQFIKLPPWHYQATWWSKNTWCLNCLFPSRSHQGAPNREGQKRSFLYVVPVQWELWWIYIYIYIYMYVCIKEYPSLYFSYICITIQRIPIKKSISSKSIVSNENISIIPGFFRITKILRGSFLFFRHFVPVPIYPIDSRRQSICMHVCVC